MRYMLGTDSILDLVNGKSASLRGRLARYTPESLCMSALTTAELEHVIKRLSPADPARRSVRQLLKHVKILPWDADCSHWYAELFFQQESLATSIGTMDLMIAAHSIAAGAILVSSSIRDELDQFDAPLRAECWS